MGNTKLLRVPPEGQQTREEPLRFIGVICFASKKKNFVTIGEMCWQFKLFLLSSLDPPGGPLPTKQVYFWATFNKHPHTPGMAYYVRYSTDTSTDTSRSGLWLAKYCLYAISSLLKCSQQPISRGLYGSL